MTNTRETLGEFVAAECLQQMRLHVEDLAGRGPVLGAGRMRGAGLIEFLGLTGSKPATEEVRDRLNAALGIDGTRLAIVDEITEVDGTYTVKIHEGACSYRAKTEEPMCVYTLGVFIGALGALYGKTMTGKEKECEAVGDTHCVYVIKPHIALD